MPFEASRKVQFEQGHLDRTARGARQADDFVDGDR
jgi:hypothetical protein